MKRATQRIMFGMMVGVLLLASSSIAQEKAAAGLTKYALGQKVKISGQIVKKDADSFIVRTVSGENIMVKLTAATVIKEKKLNLFRGAKNYTTTHLVRGLEVEVEGLGDYSGALAARDIKFTQTEYLVATSVESRVTPVEGRLTETESRLARSEENAKHLSGQVEEVREVATTARGNAKTAQDSANSAAAGVAAANNRISEVSQNTNARISAVDNYEVKNAIDVRFKLNSAVLTPEAKAKLDELIKEAIAQRGYMIEVTGFASADGNEEFNRKLSQRRAEAVVQYLADNMIPLRRIAVPFGFGAKMPVADNKTRAGREENRRVSVKILISKGLTADDPAAQGAIKN